MATGGGGDAVGRDRRPRRARRRHARAAGHASTRCRRCAATPTSTSPRRPPRTARSSLRRLVRRFRWPLSLVAALVLVDAGTTLVGPLLIRHGLDAGVGVDNGARAAGDVRRSSSRVQLLSWGNQIVELLYTSRTSERMLYTLRARTFAHLQRLSLDYYDQEMGGRIMTRMTTDVEALANLLQQGLLLALTSVVGCVGVVVILLVLDVRLALVAFVVLPVLAVLTVWFQRALAPVVPAGPRRHLDRQRRDAGEPRRRARHAVARAATTTTPSASPPARREYRDARLRSMQLMSIYFAGSQFLQHGRQGARALVRRPPDRRRLADVGRADRVPALPRPVLLAAAAAVGGVRPVDPGPHLARPPRRAARHAVVDAARPPTRSSPATWVGDVALEGVRFAYSPDAPEALRGVDLRIAPASASPSSARPAPASRRSSSSSPASTTRPSGGCSSTATTSATSTCTRYRRHLGYVPQEPFLFSGTIRSNIAYGRPDATDLEIERAARAVGAHDLVRVAARRLPHAGRRDRPLAVGRASASCCAWPGPQLVDPTILILDEATSNLDLATEAEVQRAMNLASQGRTTLLIAHRLQTARNATRIVVVEEGRLVEDGSHDELVAAGGRYAELWDAFDSATQPV